MLGSMISETLALYQMPFQVINYTGEVNSYPIFPVTSLAILPITSIVTKMPAKSIAIFPATSLVIKLYEKALGRHMSWQIKETSLTDWDGTQ